MSSEFGQSFEVEMMYREERVREDFRRPRGALTHWVKDHWHRHGGTRR